MEEGMLIITAARGADNQLGGYISHRVASVIVL